MTTEFLRPRAFLSAVVALTAAFVHPPNALSQTYDWRNLAGDPGGPGFTDGIGRSAAFQEPNGVAVDGSGNIYVADLRNATIRKITSAGVVTTLAGAPGHNGTANGAGSAARFLGPTGVAVDGNGNVYVADPYNNQIRKITPDGVVTLFAGSAGQYGAPGASGDADGTGTAARFYHPYGVAVDRDGNVFVADTGSQTIRKITPAGVVTTIAGTPDLFGSADGVGRAASFRDPKSVAVDAGGNIFVTDSGNGTIRKITSVGRVTTLAGRPGGRGDVDGTGSAARFSSMDGIAVDNDDNVYVAEPTNGTIRKITAAGVVTTIAGRPGNSGDADGMEIVARFVSPEGLALDGSGDLFVSDSGNSTIREILAGGLVTTTAGSTTHPGSADGSGNVAGFYSPVGVAVDALGSAYVADTGNSTIRKITPQGRVTTLAGTPGTYGDVDASGRAAAFDNPYGVAVDNGGNIYVADEGNSAIRKVTPGGVMTTIAGRAAGLSDPKGVAVDGTGNVYVANAGNEDIVKNKP